MDLLEISNYEYYNELKERVQKRLLTIDKL